MESISVRTLDRPAAVLRVFRCNEWMFNTMAPNDHNDKRTAILDAAALGFLGMGAQPPTPEWGTMLAEAREFILRAWWVVTLPGCAILLTVLAINLMGDGLRDALDPKLKRS